MEALEATLLSVLENRPPRCEVIGVHAHPYNDPYQLQGEVRLIKAPERSSYAACANLGFRETSADVLHLLAAGCQVAENWTDGVMKHFADPRVAVVAPMLLDEEEPSHVLAAGIAYGAGGVRRAYVRCAVDMLNDGLSPVLACSLHAAFYNRIILSSVGYLSTEVGADLADVDLGLLLRHAGFSSLLDPRLRVRAPNRPLEVLSPYWRAIYSERLFWRNAPVVGWLKSLAAHPIAVAADFAHHFPAMLPKLAGRVIGMSMIGSARRHHQRQQDLRNSAPLPADPPGGRQMRVDRPHGRSAAAAKEPARERV